MIKNRIYLSPPHMNGNERELILDAFDSNWIAPLGPHVDAFEKEVTDYIGSDIQTLALSSGTAALHLALSVLNIGAGDVVLCPSLTFAASANVIMYVNATPIFVDVSMDTWTIDLDALENAIKKHKPKALISVDIYGQSADYDQIIELCNKKNVIVIEDSAEALGAKYKGKKCGMFGEMGIFSFNGNKIITTSGGGMLLSDNHELINKARFLSMQARENVIHYEHSELGYNYRMSNILAALGRGQLKHLNNFVDKRREIFDKYNDLLGDIEQIKFMPEAKYGRSSRWLTTLTVNGGLKKDVTLDIINALEENNIESRPVWKPMHLQPYYSKYPYVKKDNFDVSKYLFTNGICLPSGTQLKEKEQYKISQIIKNVLNHK